MSECSEWDVEGGGGKREKNERAKEFRYKREVGWEKKDLMKVTQVAARANASARREGKGKGEGGTCKEGLHTSGSRPRILKPCILIFDLSKLHPRKLG